MTVFIEQERGFQLAPIGTNISTLETPCVIVDINIAERNLRNWQDQCDFLGIANRPHVKTHKSSYWGHRQEVLGAVGVTCQTLREAEVMADTGVKNILIAYNIIGVPKLARLVALARRALISVVADSAFVVEGLSAAALANAVTIGVLVECDTGAGRCGVKTPGEVLPLAKQIASSPGLSFLGMLTYPAPGGRQTSGEFLAAAKALCDEQGLPVQIVSSGGTPDKNSDAGLEIVTEYRAGTYIYNDRSLMARGTCKEGDCALSVLATIVSRHSANRAIIDAGSKALTSDLLGLPDFGLVVGHPSLKVTRLDEEHGYLDQTDGELDLDVGDLVRIIPNHACVVSNLFDRVALVRGPTVVGYIRVDARGRID